MSVHSSLVKGYSCRALCLAIPLLLATIPMATSAQPYIITDNAYPYRTATGYQTLFSNTTGYDNTASGYQGLYFNTTGSDNTASGVAALLSNTTGNSNTASGAFALDSNTTGNSNTASGYGALLSNTTGRDNIALGYQSGANITNKSNNIDIGNSGVNTDSGVIRIGTAGTQTQTFITGIGRVNIARGIAVYVNANGQLGTVTSSKRFKKDIHSLGTVSDKLLNLRPVSFRYKESAEDGTYPVQYGLIAEEVAKVYPDLVQYDKEGKPFTVYYHLLTPLILRELQKEHQQNVAQQQALVAQQNLNQTQQQALVVQRMEMTTLRTQNQALLKEVTFIKTQQQTVIKVMMQRMNQLEQAVQASHNGSPTIKAVPTTYRRSL